jgi:hypothetical protein
MSRSRFTRIGRIACPIASRVSPNQAQQQTAAEMVVPRDLKAHSAAAAAELSRSERARRSDRPKRRRTSLRASVSSDRSAQEKEELRAGPHTLIGHLKKMPGKHSLRFGLTNDAFGQIVTNVDFVSFPPYVYVSRTSLGEVTSEILIEKALDLVNRSPASDH